MRILTECESPVRCIAYSPDGKLLAAGDEGNGLLFWSLPDGTFRERAWVWPDDSAEAVAFSPNGTRIAVGGPNLIMTWNPLTEAAEEVSADGHEMGTRALAWLPHGRELVSVGWDRTLRFWTPNLTPVRPPIQTPEPMVSLAIHPSGTEVVAGGAQHLLLFWFHDEQLKTWQQRPAFDLGRPVFALALSRDGTRLAVGLANGDIQVWDFARRECVATLTGHEWVLYGLAFTPDGSRLVSGGADGTVRLWDVPNSRLIETYQWHRSWVTCVAVSPDGMTAAAGSNDKSIVVWDLADV